MHPWLLAAILLQAVPRPQTAPPVDALERMNQAIDALTRKVWPSVVQIQVSGYGARDENPRDDVSAVITRQRSVGSGFVIDPDGYIITNAHVVNGAEHISIVVPPADADGSLATALSPRLRVLPARVIGVASEVDLALLRVENTTLPALPLAAYAQVRQGETVFAFGSPGGLRNTLTHGVVSAVARQVDPDSPLIYIQTDAPINPGNSGGPLVNTRGEVVGVNTFILSNSGGSDGLGFAVPSATVRVVFKQLLKYGVLRRQEVGMSLQTINHPMAVSLGLPRDAGVVVSDVWPGGPAEAAGLKIGDVMVSIDDEPADNVPTVSYKFRLRDSKEPVKIVVLRGTAEMTFHVAAVEEKNELDAVSGLADPLKNLIPELGILGIELDPQVAAAAKGLRDPWGIVVVARAPGSGPEVPLQPRDVIRSVNNQPTPSIKGLRDRLQALKPGSPVTLQVQRDGRLTFVTFTLD
ncbi:MAG TPA: trypsin-like peptidase domain-containing protein [Vicinamibacterales bacterium]|jgi:serine protease Do